MSSELFTFKEFICKTGRQVRRDGNSLSYSATRSGLFVTMQQQTVCVLPAQETYTLTNAQKQTPFLQGHYTCSCESVDITFQMGGDIWVSFLSEEFTIFPSHTVFCTTPLSLQVAVHGHTSGIKKACQKSSMWFSEPYFEWLTGICLSVDLCLYLAAFFVECTHFSQHYFRHITNDTVLLLIKTILIQWNKAE